MTLQTKTILIAQRGRARLLTLLALTAITQASGAQAPTREQERENRIQCASNLRTICQAAKLYAQEHDGKYPKDVGEILRNMEITVVKFICPGSGNAPPQPTDVPTVDQVVRWAEEEADYVYCGGGLTLQSGADALVAYERGEPHGPQGMNMVFADGKARFVPMDEARKLIAKVAPTTRPAR